MIDADHAQQSYRGYVVSVLGFIASSFAALGLVLAIAILIVGNISLDATLDLDFERLDAFWMLLGLPATAAVLFLILSPISWLFHRLLPGGRRRGTR